MKDKCEGCKNYDVRITETQELVVAVRARTPEAAKDNAEVGHYDFIVKSMGHTREAHDAEEA